VITAHDMRSIERTGWIRKGREHSYTISADGRQGLRQAWDQGRLARVPAPRAAAGRLRSVRRGR